MENAVQIRGATAQDAQVFFALNLAFNGEGVASPQEAALALAHPGPERVLLAFVAGEPAGFLCGLLKRSACYSRPSAEVTELYVCPGCRRQGVAGSCWRLSWTPAATRAWRPSRCSPGRTTPPPRPCTKKWAFPPAGRPTSSRGCEYGSKKSPGFSGGFPVYQAFALQSARRFS